MKLKQDRERRIQWLLAHVDLWREADTEHLWLRDRLRYKSIGLRMVEAGLFSCRTAFVDMRIGSLINIARGRLEKACNSK